MVYAPNVYPKFNQYQPNQQLVSSLQPRPIYNPYISVLDESRPPSLYMSNIERSSLVPQRSHSQSVINEIRAGNSRVRGLFITIWMLHSR